MPQDGAVVVVVVCEQAYFVPLLLLEHCEVSDVWLDVIHLLKPPIPILITWHHFQAVDRLDLHSTLLHRSFDVVEALNALHFRDFLRVHAQPLVLNQCLDCLLLRSCVLRRPQDHVFPVSVGFEAFLVGVSLSHPK